MLFNTNKGFYVKKLLTNATVGDIAGSAYEGLLIGQRSITKLRFSLSEI